MIPIHANSLFTVKNDDDTLPTPEEVLGGYGIESEDGTLRIISMHGAVLNQGKSELRLNNVQATLTVGHTPMYYRVTGTYAKKNGDVLYLS